ncbi:MAG: GntR family transcriptional regulator [Brevinema sp.]
MAPQNNSVPLYLQIKEQLKQDITSGLLVHGQKIPNELELTEKYGVSRITIRKAIETLSKANLLVRKQGKGTFVVKPKIERQIASNFSHDFFVRGFTDMMTDLKMKTSTKVVDVTIKSPSKFQQEALKLGDDEQIISTQRIRFADKEAISYEINIFPYSSFTFLLTQNLEESLYEILKRYEIFPHHADHTEFEAIQAGATIASNLNIGIFDPVLHQTAVILDKDYNPVHICDHFFVGSRYKFIVG